MKRRARRQRLPHEQHLGGLGGQQAERREVADGIPGQDGAKRRPRREPGGADLVGAENPGLRSGEEAAAAEQHDHGEPAAHGADALFDFRPAYLPDRHRQQRDPDDGRDEADEGNACG